MIKIKPAIEVGKLYRLKLPYNFWRKLNTGFEIENFYWKRLEAGIIVMIVGQTRLYPMDDPEFKDLYLFEVLIEKKSWFAEFFIETPTTFMGVNGTFDEFLEKIED